MQTSLISLIQQHRPRRALFTSYTFSVSWFETFALPALMRNGCEQVDLLVDYRKASESTYEAGSQYAGSAYRVIAVPMNGKGIFHPKIAYFEAAEPQASDVLLVGSGNLTHAGQGQNLEIFDGVTHDLHPHVFGEFADFLTEFQARYQFSAENLKSLKHFEARARLKGKTEIPADHESRTTWLVHTMTHAASRQFVDIAMGTLERPDMLRVLAPYHAPSGAPIARLAKEVKVDEISIALSGGHPVAPFDENVLELPENVKYVIPITDNGDRFAHAKHFEVRSEEASVLMTGSVNATVQSLETLKNVEISLVRKVPVSLLDWEEVTPISFEPCDFRDESHAKSQCTLQASWTSSNWVEGSLTPTKSARTMNLSIWDEDACLARYDEVTVAVDGSFKVRMTTVPTTENALVIQLEDAQLCARGWLNMEYALGGSPADRHLLRSSVKLLSGEYSEADLKALFLWMESLLARSARSGSSGKKRAAGSQEADEDGSSTVTTPEDYEKWFDEALSDNYGSSTVNAARMSVAAAFAWLNRDLPPPSDEEPREKKPDGEPKTKRSIGSDIKLLDNARSEYNPNASTESKRERADIKGEELYEKLLENVPRALERDNASTMAALVVQLSGSAALKRMLASPPPYSAIDHDDAHYIGRRATEFWLTKYSKFNYSLRNRHGLLPTFCALACATLHYNPYTRPEALNEAVQSLAQRFVHADEMKALARLGLSNDGFRRVPLAVRDLVVGTADRIAAVMTVTHQLTTLLRDLFTDGTTFTRAPAPYTAVFADLKVRSRNKFLRNKKFGVIQGSTGLSPHCPCCNSKIGSDDMLSLRMKRNFTCLTCQAPLFYGLHPAELMALGLGEHFRTT
jgi:hypothetical protein